MTELHTTLTAVAVYPDRARVTRTGTVTLEPGPHRLAVRELPLKLDPASVRVSAKGSARARLLGVDVRRDFYTETPAERVRELEAQVEALEDEMRALDAQAELLQREHDALGELSGQTQAYARGLAFGKTTAEAHMALLDGLRSRAEGLNAALLDLAARRRDLERRLQKLRAELDQLRGSRGRERYTVVVEVDVAQAGGGSTEASTVSSAEPLAEVLTVELTYVVSDAGWQPLYDVRLLEGDEGPLLEVGYLAQVTQRTGEDWDSVALALSTARPALAETLPELDPWYIGPIVAHKRPTAAPTARMAGRGGPLAAAVLALSAEPEPEPLADQVEATVVTATVDTSGAAVTYQVPGTVAVPADGAPHKVAVARFELAPELDYVATPKLVQVAYRRAKLVNDSPYTLLPGPANLFAGDEFIGTTPLELIAPQGEIELYLGADDRVRVERELKRREVDKRLIGDRRRLRYGYEIELENLLPAEAHVTLHDQIPVSRHEDIKVKLESAEPAPTGQTELNLLQWELTLAPGQKQVVRFDFLVEHPRSMTLLGLP